MPSRYAILQRARHAGVILLVLAAARSIASAQGRVPVLTATQDLRIDAGAQHVKAAMAVAIGPAGEIIVGQGVEGDGVRAFDSTGKALPWFVQTGSRRSDVGYAPSIGWSGNDFVVNDPGFEQFAVVTLAGKVTKSIPYPKLVRPKLADRRKFPTLSAADPLALYSDRSMLAVLRPEGPSLEAPEYDRSVQHIVRVSESGSIIRQVATAPLSPGPSWPRTLPSSMPMARLFPARSWHASPSGQRIAVVSTKPTGRDSVLVRITMLGEMGDTVFSTSYSTPLAVVPKAVLDSATASRNTQPRGRRVPSVADTAALPRFYPAVSSVRVGRDFTVWIETVDAKGRRYIVLDQRGAIAGTFSGGPNFRVLETERSRVWGVEMDRNGVAAIVRYRLGAAAK